MQHQSNMPVHANHQGLWLDIWNEFHKSLNCVQAREAQNMDNIQFYFKYTNYLETLIKINHYYVMPDQDINTNLLSQTLFSNIFFI